MRFFLILSLIFFNINNIKAQETINSNNLILIDEVPKKQKKRKIMSLLISSCKYGIYQISDKQLTKSRLSMLKKHLSNNLSEKLKSDSIIVKNFTIHINSARSLKGSVKNSNKGLIADLLIKEEKVGCSDNDLYGSYNLKEIPKHFLNKNLNPLIVVIDLEIKGKLYHSRTLNITEKRLKAKRKFPEFTQFINEAIRKNSSELADLLKNEG